MPRLMLKVPGGGVRAFDHRGSQADLGVIRQVFAGREYSVKGLRRGKDITDRYDAILADGATPLIIDSGANIGASVVFWALTYPKARIVAIEPDKDNFSLLQKNTAGLNVELHNAAVGCRAGRATLLDPGEGEWGYRTVRADAGDTAVISMAETVSAQQQLGRVGFINKIDIEGGEGDLFSADTDWVDHFCLVILEPHDWMLPRSAVSRNFLACVSKLDRDFVFSGENIFSIRN